MVLGLGNSIITSAPLGGATIYTPSYSWDFDGTDEQINCGNSSDIKLTTTDTSEGTGISVATWVKADDWNSTSTRSLVNCFQNNGGWYISLSNRVQFAIRSASGTRTCTSNYKPFESASDVHYRASGWHHFVGTFDGRYAKLYIDGALSSNTNTVDIGSDDNVIEYTTSPANRNADFMFGADPGNLQTSDGGFTYPSGTSTAGAYFPGLINEVGIFNKALDLDAIKEMFDAVDVDGSVLDLTQDSGDYDYSENLVGLWRGNEGSGTTAGDEEGSNNGTLHGGVTFSSTVPS